MHKRKKIAVPKKLICNSECLNKNYSLVGCTKTEGSLIFIKQLLVNDERQTLFQLLFNEIDMYTLKSFAKYQVINLFSPNGVINFNKKNFIVQIFEIHVDDLQYIVFGYDPTEDNIFLYITFIFSNFRCEHVSFPTNSNKFHFDPSYCLSKDSLSIAISSASSIKLIVLQSPLRLKNIDIDRFISEYLGQATQQLDTYKTEIIGKDPRSSAFLACIGIVYYSVVSEQWKLVCLLYSISIEDGKMNFLQKFGKNYPKRPQGKQMLNAMDLLFNNLKSQLIIDRYESYSNSTIPSTIKIPGYDIVIIN